VIGNDIDAEVDFACSPSQLSDCGTFAVPDIGLVNFTLKGDSFPNGLSLEDQMSCMPVGNWTLENNNFGTGGLVAQFDAAYSLNLGALKGCGPQSGLVIKDNVSSFTGQPCCGKGSTYLVLQGWTNVTIADNHLVYDNNQGLNGSSVIDFWGDSHVAITNNTFLNMYVLTSGDAPSGWPATTNVTACGNTLGPPQYPRVEPACSA
jgi:hypothetical protein